MSARPRMPNCALRHPLLWLLLPCSLVAAGAAAQSLESSASVHVSNLDYNGTYNVLALEYDLDAGGLAVANLAETEFTGLDSNGDTQTMIYAGGARAFVVAPGERPGLHAQVHGSLQNTFYNFDNPPYFDATVDPPQVDPDGIPDYFQVYARAKKVELLSYGGFGAGQYYARYVYRIHGHVSGTGDGANSAFLIFQVGNNPQEYASFHPNLPNGEFAGTYATQRYLVGNGQSHEEKTTFVVSYEADTQSLPEGSDIAGSVDFSETVTLDYIEVVDENDNPVHGWTVDTASGLDYDLPIFRSDFEPVAPEEPAFAKNAAEICARLRRVAHPGATHTRRVSACAGPIGAIREIKLHQLGARGAVTEGEEPS